MLFWCFVRTIFILKNRIANHSGKSGNSGNFQIVENLKETQGDSGKLREVLRFKKSQEIFLIYLEWDLINMV